MKNFELQFMISANHHIFNAHNQISLKAKQHIHLLCNSLCFISLSYEETALYGDPYLEVARCLTKKMNPL